MNQLISVIIPIFRAKDYIEKCVVSLMAQSYPSLEIIFIDDCGADDSWRVLQNTLLQYEDNNIVVKLIQHTSNKGVAAARNTGLKWARGEYITFLDADDWIEPDAYHEMMKCAFQHGADIVWTGFYYSYLKKERKCLQAVKETTGNCIRALLTEELHGALWNKLYRRSLFVDNNIMFDEGLDVWEDLYANVRLFFCAQRVKYLPKAFYHYIQFNQHSITGEHNDIKLRHIDLNLRNIERYLEKEKDYHIELNILKLAAKQTMLFETDLKWFKKWSQTYPEANKYVFRFNALPLHFRLLSWCAAREYWGSLSLWIFLKTMKKSLQSKFTLT